MILLDANILLYVHNEGVVEHQPVMRWLKKTLVEGDVIGLPWVSLWAFFRIATNVRLVPKPKSPAEVFSVFEYWSSQPGVVLLNPGVRHGEILERLMIQHQIRGPLVADTVLAVLAIEYGAILASTDQDFSRFSGITWVNPLAL